MITTDVGAYPDVRAAGPLEPGRLAAIRARDARAGAARLLGRAELDRLYRQLADAGREREALCAVACEHDGPEGAARRAVCPVCDTPHQVRRDGRLRLHQSPGTHRPCPGSDAPLTIRAATAP